MATDMSVWLTDYPDANVFVELMAQAEGLAETLTHLQTIREVVATHVITPDLKAYLCTDPIMAATYVAVPDADKDTITHVCEGVAGKVWEAIVSFFKKIADWFKKLFGMVDGDAEKKLQAVQAVTPIAEAVNKTPEAAKTAAEHLTAVAEGRKPTVEPEAPRAAEPGKPTATPMTIKRPAPKAEPTPEPAKADEPAGPAPETTGFISPEVMEDFAKVNAVLATQLKEITAITESNISPKLAQDKFNECAKALNMVAAGPSGFEVQYNQTDMSLFVSFGKETAFLKKNDINSKAADIVRNLPTMLKRATEMLNERRESIKATTKITQVAETSASEAERAPQGDAQPEVVAQFNARKAVMMNVQVLLKAQGEGVNAAAGAAVKMTEAAGGSAKSAPKSVAAMATQWSYL